MNNNLLWENTRKSFKRHIQIAWFQGYKASLFGGKAQDWTEKGLVFSQVAWLARVASSPSR